MVWLFGLNRLISPCFHTNPDFLINRYLTTRINILAIRHITIKVNKMPPTKAAPIMMLPDWRAAKARVTVRTAKITIIVAETLLLPASGPFCSAFNGEICLIFFKGSNEKRTVKVTPVANPSKTAFHEM